MEFDDLVRDTQRLVAELEHRGAAAESEDVRNALRLARAFALSLCDELDRVSSVARASRLPARDEAA